MCAHRQCQPTLLHRIRQYCLIPDSQGPSAVAQLMCLLWETRFFLDGTLLIQGSLTVITARYVPLPLALRVLVLEPDEPFLTG